MKSLKPILLFLTVFVFACDKDGDDTQVLPICIETRLENFMELNEDCSRSSVISYKFQGMEVYAFADGICISDGGIQVLDEDCEQLCYLGGIGSLEDCGGVNFFEIAEEIEVIWEVE